MSRLLAAEFDTRRDAEMTVEHLVQEHNIDRAAVTIVAASDENSAGTRVAGSDTEDGHPKPGSDGEPALAGKLRVSVKIEDSQADKVLSTFATYNGFAVDA